MSDWSSIIISLREEMQFNAFNARVGYSEAAIVISCHAARVIFACLSSKHPRQVSSFRKYTRAPV